MAPPRPGFAPVPLRAAAAAASLAVPAEAAGGAGQVVLQSFVAGIGECADLDDLLHLRAGMPLVLRPAPRRHGGGPQRLLVALPGGRPLGWLPEDEMQALRALGADPAATSVRVAALVPGYQRPRIQLRIAVPTGGMAPPARPFPPTRRPAAGAGA
jgi:hypothetical protein